MKIARRARILLWPLAVIYGAIVHVRSWLYTRGWLTQKRLKGTVISVGNLTTGGTGKTPMVIWLAEKFLREGKRVAILSRGYRGADGTSDEIELMKYRLQGRALFGVGKNRYAEGCRLESQGIDVYLLDDGFQHLQLARDADVVLLDSSRPLTRDHLLPWGHLREPIHALFRAHMAVFTRCESGNREQTISAGFARFPVFSASVGLLGFREKSPDSPLLDSNRLGSGPFFAFCGIGNPESFFRNLAEWNVPLTGRSMFRDHHRYSTADARAILKAARENSAKALLTTEKDAYNLRDVDFGEFPVYMAVIAMQVNEEDRFWSALEEILQKKAAS